MSGPSGPRDIGDMKARLRRQQAAPPAVGTNGPRPPAAPRAAALLEAAAAFTRLALAELEGKPASPDEVGAACGRVSWVLLGDNPAPVDVAVACVRLVGAVRPTGGHIEITASQDGGLSVDVLGVEVPEGGCPWKGVYPPSSDRHLPEKDPRKGWHVIEKSEFRRGEVYLTLRLPMRAATPEEIAEEQRESAGSTSEGS